MSVAKVRRYYYIAIAMKLKGIDEAVTMVLRLQQLKKFKHLT